MADGTSRFSRRSRRIARGREADSTYLMTVETTIPCATVLNLSANITSQCLALDPVLKLAHIFSPRIITGYGSLRSDTKGQPEVLWDAGGAGVTKGRTFSLDFSLSDKVQQVNAV
jgi:hypothetical protein